MKQFAPRSQRAYASSPAPASAGAAWATPPWALTGPPSRVTTREAAARRAGHRPASAMIYLHEHHVRAHAPIANRRSGSIWSHLQKIKDWYKLPKLDDSVFGCLNCCRNDPSADARRSRSVSSQHPDGDFVLLNTSPCVYMLRIITIFQFPRGNITGWAARMAGRVASELGER